MGEGEQNVEVARRAIAALDARDPEGVLACFDVGALFEPLSTPVRTRAAGEAAGHAGLRRYLRDLERVWERFDVSIESWRSTGDRVVGLGRIHAVARDGSFDSVAPVGIVLRFRDGKIVHGKVYSSPREALAAAGLPDD